MVFLFPGRGFLGNAVPPHLTGAGSAQGILLPQPLLIFTQTHMHCKHTHTHMHACIHAHRHTDTRIVHNSCCLIEHTWIAPSPRSLCRDHRYAELCTAGHGIAFAWTVSQAVCRLTMEWWLLCLIRCLLTSYTSCTRCTVFHQLHSSEAVNDCRHYNWEIMDGFC